MLGSRVDADVFTTKKTTKQKKEVLRNISLIMEVCLHVNKIGLKNLG